MRILYAGDSPVGGPANYLLAVLRALRATVRHVPPASMLSPQLLRVRYDAIIVSDFSSQQTPRISQRAILQQVEAGTGLLMIGGWGSFSGPLGHWRGSLLETALPVRCLAHDDRVNFPGGAVVIPRDPHPMFRGLSFARPPSICGLNRVQPKSQSRVVLSARQIRTPERPGAKALRITLDPRAYPLLVLDGHSRRRIAALTTDVAPHWCGGLVDWGRRRVTLPVAAGIHVEVGDRYVRFLSCLITWLGGARFHVD